MKTLTIKINNNGKIEVEADGFRDSTCLDHLDILEELLGNVEKIRKKPEAYIRAKQENKLKA